MIREEVGAQTLATFVAGARVFCDGFWMAERIVRRLQKQSFAKN